MAPEEDSIQVAVPSFICEPAPSAPKTTRSKKFDDLREAREHMSVHLSSAEEAICGYRERAREQSRRTKVVRREPWRYTYPFRRCRCSELNLVPERHVNESANPGADSGHQQISGS